MSTDKKQMTDYTRLVKEWADVHSRFEERVRLNIDIKLAEFLRGKGIDSKKKTHDSVGGGGHKDYLRRVTKNTECLNHGTTPAEWLAHASRQLKLYQDKMAKQGETGAGSIRTEVTRTVAGGAEAKAGEAKAPGEKKERVPGAVTALLKAMKDISEAEDGWRSMATEALEAYNKAMEAKKARAAKKKAEKVTTVTTVAEEEEEEEDEPDTESKPEPTPAPAQAVEELDEEEEEEDEEEEDEEEEAKPLALPSDAILAPAPEPPAKVIICRCSRLGCKATTGNPALRLWIKDNGKWICPVHKKV